jgi:hypothetical protein
MMLFWTLSGALAALLGMALAPANALRLGTAPPELPDLIWRSLRYGYDFIRDTFRSLPVPSLFSFFTPFVMFFGMKTTPAPRLTQRSMKALYVVLAVAPVLLYGLIVASFAPSVYGQSFPVERARFAGQLCLVTAVMIEGAGFGFLLAQWRPRRLESFPARMASAMLLGFLALYPLRAAWLTLGDIPEYRERARLWDARDAYIRRHAAAGEREIIVPGFSGIYGIKEVDGDPSHWINLCAAQYYRVDSIIAASISDEDVWEYLGE